MITIYINTNNNSDKTEDILKMWIQEYENKYMKIDFENHNIKELNNTNTKPHDWNAVRFKRLGEIRNKSLQKTIEHNCDYYFVIDCDNFIIPETLEDLITENKEIIAPMLRAMPEK